MGMTGSAGDGAIVARRWPHTLAVAAVSVALAAAPFSAKADEFGRWGERRGITPVQITLQHLERLERFEPVNNNRQRDRYDHAIRHLSQFADHWERGYFDRSKLDESISDVQHLLDHNPIDPRGRGALWNDLSNLRAFRASRGYGRFEEGYRRGY